MWKSYGNRQDYMCVNVRSIVRSLPKWTRMPCSSSASKFRSSYLSVTSLNSPLYVSSFVHVGPKFWFCHFAFCGFVGSPPTRSWVSPWNIPSTMTKGRLWQSPFSTKVRYGNDTALCSFFVPKGSMNSVAFFLCNPFPPSALPIRDREFGWAVHPFFSLSRLPSEKCIFRHKLELFQE